MKSLIVVLMCVMLVACQRSVTDKSIAFAQEQCKQNEGVDFIVNEGYYRDRSTEYRAQCKNNVTVTFRIQE